MEPEHTEATLAERKKALEEEERVYLEFLAKIDHLSTNPAPYERDPLLPELLAELNRAVAVPAEEPRSEPQGLKGVAFRTAKRLLAPELARLESAITRERELHSTLIQFLNRFCGKRRTQPAPGPRSSLRPSSASRSESTGSRTRRTGSMRRSETAAPIYSSNPWTSGSRPCDSGSERRMSGSKG